MLKVTSAALIIYMKALRWTKPSSSPVEVERSLVVTISFTMRILLSACKLKSKRIYVARGIRITDTVLFRLSCLS